MRAWPAPAPAPAGRRPAAAGSVSLGTGRSITHHGELLQGAVRQPGGPVPCLVSLPRRDRAATARLELFEADGLEVVPGWKRKALRAARIALARCGAARTTGRLVVRSDVGTGFGLGSSTADIVAAIRAVAAACGAPFPAEQVAAIAIEAETASDPLMFDRFALLFAQRQGRVLESWGDWHPDYLVLSGRLMPGSSGVDTLSLPANGYSGAELDRFESIVDAARRGFRHRDAAAIAAAATASAVLNQRRLPLPRFGKLLALAQAAGALGVQIAHSGVVGGVLLDPRNPALEAKVGELAARWRESGFGSFERFRTTAAPLGNPLVRG